jgi:hypothetical protein
MNLFVMKCVTIIRPREVKIGYKLFYVTFTQQKWSKVCCEGFASSISIHSKSPGWRPPCHWETGRNTLAAGVFYHLEGFGKQGRC